MHERYKMGHVIVGRRESGKGTGTKESGVGVHAFMDEGKM
jgi:hypothetical protein